MLTQYDFKAVISGKNVEFFTYGFPVKCKRPIKIKTKKPFHQPDLLSFTFPLEKPKVITAKNLARTKTNLRRLVSANKTLRRFITLTYNTEVFDLKQSNYMFNQFIKRLQYYYKDFDLKYVAVPEFQPTSGRLHYHMLVNIPYLHYDILKELWGNGAVDIRKIYRIKDLGLYISKYLTKDNIRPEFFGKKKFFCSRNLKRSVILFAKEAYNYFYKHCEKLVKYFEKVFISDYYGYIQYTDYQLIS